MKVGDLVKFKGTTCDYVGNPGLGTVVGFLTAGVKKENSSAEVYWPNLEITQWHAETNLEVLSECK